MEKPNILFIQCDSMSAKALGCIGDKAARTPNLDALASRGMVLRNACCNSPQCVPSRSSMWSGLYVHSIQAWNNFKGLEPGSPTFADGLAASGYEVRVTGRTDHLSGSHTLENRMNAWTRKSGIQPYARTKPKVILEEGKGRRLAELDWQRMEEAKEVLGGLAREGKPFFYHVGFSLPHQPFRTSPYWKDKIDASEVTVPPYEEELHPVMEYMSRAKNCHPRFGDGQIVDLRRTYYAMVAELDAIIGELLDEADALGLAENTYFVFTSDHGEMNMEHRQTFKACMYDASVRVPLIVAGPDALQGKVSDELVSLVDVAPTLYDLAGAPPVAGLPGASLVPVLSGGTLGRDLVFSEFHSNGQNADSYMVFDGRYKYIRYGGYPSQLFDLREDADELRNLAGTRKDLAAKFEARLAEIVDCEKVDAQTSRYDRQSFSGFKAQAGQDYDGIMRGIYPGWDEEVKPVVEGWLARDGEG